MDHTFYQRASKRPSGRNQLEKNHLKVEHNLLARKICYCKYTVDIFMSDSTNLLSYSGIFIEQGKDRVVNQCAGAVCLRAAVFVVCPISHAVRRMMAWDMGQ
jgi:hypothetical protein